jgi:hypothetical protein
MSALFLSVTNFINRFSNWIDCSKSARNEEPILTRPFEWPPRFGDSGFQLNLEIALSGVSAKVQSAFQPGRRCVETSDDVIKDLVQSSRHRVKPFSFLI